MQLIELLQQGDAVTRAVALLLLLMSVCSWVVILWKAWLLRRAALDVQRSTAAFWQAGSLDAAHDLLATLDREALVLPLLDATRPAPAGVLASSGDRAQQLTRALRDALHRATDKLQFGQVLLASVGSISPFVGLLGTVWGIYHALTGIAASGQVGIEQVAGPVGEALAMTAAGLAVAIPAVLAYNVLGRRIGRIEADLEGFAHDLRALVAHEGAHAPATRSAP